MLNALNFDSIIEKLLLRIPEFAESDNFKYIVASGSGDIPYVVFGVLSDYYIEMHEKRANDLILKVAEFLEDMACSNDIKVKELLDFGFLENISQQEPNYDDIVATFGVKTKEELKFVNDYWNKLFNADKNNLE